jgi:PAS domain S-box-containing protein
MIQRDLTALSKEELIRELEALEDTERRSAASAGDADRERLIHDLHVHQVELEMQNRELRDAQVRLEEATARYADLYELAPVGYCTLDPAGRIQEINVTAATLLGVSRAAAIGAPFASVAPLAADQPFHAHMRRCLRETGRVTSELTFRGEARGTRSVRIISEPAGGRDGTAAAYRTSLIDITDLRALEDRLRLLSTAGERLASSPEHTAVIEAAAGVAVPALADACMIDLTTEAGAIERKLVRFGDPDKQATLADGLLRLTPRPGWQSPQAQVITSGQPMLLTEVAGITGLTTDDEGGANTLRAASHRSLMVVPLTARGRTFGALTLASAESERRYSSLDLQFAQDLASRIAIVLDNARLYADVRRSNESLRLSEAKASGIVSISADAIISIDENQHITLFNEGAEKIFGYPRAEAIGAPLELLLPDRFRSRHHRHVEHFAGGDEAARTMGERRETIAGVRKNGEEFPADASISKLAVGGKRILTVALRDVTEQRRVESEQRFLAEVGLVLAATLDYDETLTRLAELTVGSLADFCIVDVVDDDGEIRRLRVVGRDPARQWVCDALRRVEIDRSRPHLALSCLEAKGPTLIPEVTPEILASLAQSDLHLPAVAGLEARSIIAVPLLVRGKALGVLKFVSSTRLRPYGPADLRLAEEVAFRAALAIENARLYRVAERAIAARDAVLGVVAHDLRGPLGNILMQAELLRSSEDEPAPSSRSADVIERAARHMNRLIQDLLDITRIEAGSLSIEPVTIDASRLLAELVETQRPLASSRSLDLQLDLEPGLGTLVADRDRLLQVLENLVSNAVKFTLPHGRVTVGAARRGGEVLVWVADTGLGIDSRDLPHLFDRFWQARKADRRGVGLGLPIVKGLVEAHGGRIWVESQLGLGTTFYFTLPQSRPEPTVAGAPYEHHAAPTSSPVPAPSRDDETDRGPADARRGGLPVRALPAKTDNRPL